MDKFVQYQQDQVDDKTILSYINKLYCIELLRYVNVVNTDTQLAWQYGMSIGAPWVNDKQLIASFIHQEGHTLRQFLATKLQRVAKKLADGLDDLCCDLYLKVPLEPQLRLSIVNCLKEIKDDNILDRLKKEYTLSLIFGNKNQILRNVSNTLMPIEIADRLLCGVHDLYTEGDIAFKDKHIKHRLGPHREELTDDKVYLCSCAVKKFIATLRVDQESATRFAHELDDYWAALASVFSIFYRMVVPRAIHPERLDHLYRKYILGREDGVQALQYARRWRWLSIEAVVDDKLPQLNCHAGLDASTLDEHITTTAIYPNDLVEKYLVTQWFADKCCCCQQ